MSGAVRIVGGNWRRRQLRFPDLPGLRPTPDRLRETLFNWLGQDLDGWTCLDLFAGSGALGFEAASRGAARVVMVEQNRKALQSLAANRDNLAADTVEVVSADAVKYLLQTPERFDAVFLDPPFRHDILPAILPRACACALRFVYAEAEAETAAPAGWQAWRRTRAGGVHAVLFAPEA